MRETTIDTLTISAEAAAPWAGLPMILVLSGVGLVSLWLLSMVQPTWLASFLPRRGAARPAPARGVGEIQELATDLEELAERLAARLDEKAARIERLIAEADERLAKLEGRDVVEERRTESRPTPSSAPAVSALEPKTPARFVAARDLDPDPVTREICRLADKGATPAEIAKQLDEQIGKVQLILALRAS